MENLTRLTLLIKLKETDNDGAWAEFDGIYSQFIYNLIRRMDFQHHDALDLSQTVLTKVWKKIDTYEVQKKQGGFRGWLAIMTRNTVRDFIRNKRNFITSRNAVEYEDFYKGVEEHKLPKIEELAQQEWIVYITNMAKEKILKDLPEKKRLIFEMSIKEMSVGEIAQELDVSESLVYAHRQEVFKKMKKEVQHLNNEL